MSETFALTFRGETVRFNGSPSKTSWTSIYPEQYVLLTYVRTGDKIARVPSIEKVVRTAATLRREISERPVLRQWEGQSFIVRVTPGTTEVTDLTVEA